VPACVAENNALKELSQIGIVGSVGHPVRLDPVLKTAQLPAARADLNACLANVDGDNFPDHETKEKGGR
jgi:hypothetical protein